MKRKAVVTLVVGVVLLAVAILGAVQWRARDRHLTRGWTTTFGAPVADTPGATGDTMDRLCVNAPLDTYDGIMLDWALDAIEDGGYSWVRQRFSWAGVTRDPPGDSVASGPFDADQIDWPSLDTLVEATTARSIQLIAVLDDAPAWAGDPPDPVTYAAWAGAVARRYRDAITYYQVWHNPNLADSWGGAANAFEYADLLAQAATAIRASDPGARIVLGSLAPTAEAGDRNFADDLFLEMLYEAGAAPYFDVVAAQPYGFDTGPEDRRVGRDVLNFSRSVLLRDVMVARGDAGKAVWASHFGWNSMHRCWPGETSIWGHVGEIPQGEFAVGALERADREWPWMGAMCLNGLQPRPRAEGAVECTVRAEDGEVSESSVATTEAAPLPGLGESTTPDAEEHWGFALFTPEGEPRPVFSAVHAWADREPVAHAGTYRADTDLATFRGSWTLGPQGADIGEQGVNTVTFPFEGTGVALTVRRGPYRAYLYVTVDGQPAPALPRDRQGRAYVVLYDPLAEMATVPLAEGLDPGRHVVEVEADRGWGQWALADWRVVSAPPSSGLRGWGYVLFAALGAVSIGLIAGSLRHAAAFWEAVQAGWDRLSDAVQVLVSFMAAAVTLFATWQLLMGEAIFRRLGEHSDVIALALATGLFYLSPWMLLSLVAGLMLSVIVVIRPALGLALVIFASPLYAYPLSLAGKSFALAELVLLPTLVGWAVRWIGGAARDRRRLWDAIPATARALLWPLLVLVAISVLSSFGAEHLREALRELRLVVIEPTLFFLALVTLPMDRRGRTRVLDALVASAVMVSVVGLVMYGRGNVITAEGGMRRLLSVYGSPNNVGLFLGRVLPLMIALVLWGGRPSSEGTGSLLSRTRLWFGGLVRDSRRRLHLLAIVPVALALALSLSRGAIVFGIPAALIAMGWLAGKRWRRATVVVLIVGVVALVLLVQTPRFAGMFDVSQGTSGFRVSLWFSSLQLIRDRPLLGVGLDNFLYAYRTRYVLPTAWEEFNLSHPHNVLFDYAVRLGGLGLAAFVWTQVAFWGRLLPLHRRVGAAPRALVIGLAGSMADFLAHGLVDASYFIIDLAFVYMLSLALLVWLADARNETTSTGRLV